MLRERAVVVAERSRDPPEHLVDRGRDLGVLALAEPADGRFEVGQRAVRAPGGEGNLGGLVQQLAVGGPCAARGTELQGELNTALKSVKDDGTYQELYDKYFPKSD